MEKHMDSFKETIRLNASKTVLDEYHQPRKGPLKEEFCSYYTMFQLVNNIYTFAEENIKKNFAFSYFSRRK